MESQFQDSCLVSCNFYNNQMQKQRQNQKNKKQINANVNNNEIQPKILQNYMDYQNYNLSFGRSRQIRRQRMASSIYNNHCQGRQTAQEQKTDARTPKDISKTQKIQLDNHHQRFKTMDVDSFKVENNNLQHRYSTIKRKSKDNTFKLTKKEDGQKQDDFLKSVQSNSHPQYIIVEDYAVEDKDNTTAEKSGNGILELNEGWLYKGEYIQGLFHGHGQLFHESNLIYSGKFQYGYFSGYGKLQFHQLFESMVCTKSISKFLEARSSKQKELQYEHEITYSWTAYFGQFKEGKISGFGQLWISTGEKMISKWKNGQPHKKHCSVISDSSIN